MNVMALVAYALATALVLALSGWLLEWALTTLRLPARWVWLAGLGLSVWLPLASFVAHREQEAVASAGAVGVVELARLPAVEEVSRASGEGARGAFELLDDLSMEVRREVASAAALLPQVGLARARIAGAWGASSLLAAIILITSTLRLGRRVHRWPYERLLGRQVKVSPDIGPATVGILTPLIAIPRWARELPPEELELVLRHESEHVRARDTLILAIALIPLIACPWNPLVWWQVRRLKAAVEVDCDRRVLRHGVPPASYGGLLVRLGVRGHPGAFAAPAIAGSTSLLERRIRLMMTSRRRTSLPSAAIAMGAAVLLAGVACTGEAPMGMSSNAASEAGPATEISASPGHSTDQVLPIWIDRNGSVEVNGASHPIGTLSAVLKPLFTRGTVISFEAHEATPYRLVAAVQDEVRAAGFLRVVFTTVAADARRPSPQESSTLADNGFRVVLPSLGPPPPPELRAVRRGGAIVVPEARAGSPIVVVEHAAGAKQTEPGPPLSLEELPTNRELGPEQVETEPLTLEVPRAGRVLVQRGEDSRVEEVASADLESLLRREVAKNARLFIIVKTHPDAEYKRMHDTLGVLQRAGARRYTLQLAE